jgi:drug/metabolite transporter (DMT)-like permease
MAGMNRSNALRLGALGCIWGTSFLLIKVGLEQLSPAELVLGRLLAGSLVLLVFIFIRRVALPAGWVMWGHLMLMGAVASAVPFLLISWGEQRVSSGVAGLLNATTPLLTMVAAFFIVPDEIVTKARVVGLVVGFAGVVILMRPWAGSGSSLAGEMACLLASAFYGFGFAWARRFLIPSGASMISLAAGQLVCAALLVVVAFPLLGGSHSLGGVGPRVGAAVLVLGAVGTGLAYVIYYRLLADIGATRASMVTYLIPIVAVSLGVIVLGEPLTWSLFVGAAIVISGVAVAEGRLRLGRRGVEPSAEIQTAPAD